ncbi:hypothetical protein L3X38_043620 [Prunus dulcis]|uniref:Uncharacterized protein n=1 Tax=Prunus dulcis TaxID=3755 RepID=A0AAD4UX69_PRUDU|nr:hypothetical protein L3X38_043620 [Prunus dulcis]
MAQLLQKHTLAPNLIMNLDPILMTLNPIRNQDPILTTPTMTTPTTTPTPTLMITPIPNLFLIQTRSRLRLRLWPRLWIRSRSEFLLNMYPMPLPLHRL